MRYSSGVGAHKPLPGFVVILSLPFKTCGIHAQKCLYTEGATNMNELLNTTLEDNENLLAGSGNFKVSMKRDVEEI